MVNRNTLTGSLLWVALAVTAPHAAFGNSSNVSLASVGVVAVDLGSGERLVEQHADIVLPIASITKLMTGMVVVDSGADLDEYVEIRDWHATTANNAWSRIRVTSKARRKDLLRIALMASENRAAYNLAMHHPGGYDAFVAAMNAKAKALGMHDARFVDPTGLSPDNLASASDLASMLAAAHAYPLLRQYSTTRQFTVNFRSPKYRLGYGNTNPLTGSSHWDVSLTKTGYLTEAGRCLVMVTEINGREIGLALLNSFGKRSPLGDAGRIKRWLQSGDTGRVAQAARAHRNEVLKRMGRQ